MTFRLVESSRSGPDPNYSDEDLFWAMHLMSSGRSVSRSQLSDALGVGEGTVKNILSVLKNADLTSTFHTGTRLNDIGMELMAALPLIPVELEFPQALPGPYRQAIIITKALADPMTLGDSPDAAGCNVVVRDGDVVRPFGISQSIAESIMASVPKEFGTVGTLVIGYGDMLSEARRRAIGFALRIIRLGHFHETLVGPSRSEDTDADP